MWDKVLAINPIHTGAEINLAVAYYYNGRTKEAIQMAERAYRQKPQDQMVAFTLGWLYVKTGDKDYARKTLQKTVELSKESSLAFKASALLFIMDGKLDQAREMVEKSLVLDPDDTSASYYIR